MAQIDRVRTALPEPYEAIRELGRGGMAVVYLARDTRHDRQVAVKVLSRDLASVVGVERFLREIRIVAHLTHPHVLPLIDSGESDGLLYYVMPFVAGGSLRDRLREQGALSLEETLAIASQIAGALDHAHESDIIHRDVKPENILLAGDQALLADFGIARPVLNSTGEELTYGGAVLGSPLYLSPEQGLGDLEVDRRSDVYGLGCVVYEMLSGHPPYQGDTAVSVIAKHAIERVPSLRPERPEVPRHVEQAIMISLSKKREARYSTASRFARALSDPAGISASSRGTHSRRWSPSPGVVATGMIGILLASIAWIALQSATLLSAPAARLAVLPYAGAWLTAIMGVWFVFEKADAALSAEARLGIARWLSSLDPVGRVRTWPATLVAVFDRVFGERHLSLKCFSRSIIASFVVTGGLLLVWAGVRPDEVAAFSARRGLEGIAVFVTFTILLNLLADYLSLLETRYFLGRMAASRSPDNYSLYLTADVLLTLVVWLVFFTGLPLVIGALVVPALGDALFFLRAEVWGAPAGPGSAIVERVTLQDVIALRSGPAAMPVGVWFYSTFLTSVWIWIYGFCGALVRFGPRVGRRLDWMRDVLDVDHEPLRAVGLLAILIVTVLFAAGAVLHL